MQLQAHLDLNRRELDLQLEEVRNRHGEVIGVYDPEPDIDRLHIKVWFPDSEKYVCFLNCRFEDTIGTLKKKNPGAPRSCAYNLLGCEGVLQRHIAE